MNRSEVIVLIFYIIWNTFVFTLYGMDKSKAKRGKWRISENTLIISALLMGGIGALLGMRIFRHKTKHLKFQILVPISIILNLTVIAALICSNTYFPL